MRDVEAVRDSLVSEEPYQTWIPEEDYEGGELTCQTTYDEKTTTTSPTTSKPNGGSSLHPGMSAMFLSVYFWTSKLL